MLCDVDGFEHWHVNNVILYGF